MQQQMMAGNPAIAPNRIRALDMTSPRRIERLSIWLPILSKADKAEYAAIIGEAPLRGLKSHRARLLAEIDSAGAFGLD
jgi:hypothetical protein